MYIHLGNNFIISAKKIIAILNYEKSASADLRDIIDIARMEKNLLSVSEKGKAKAVVICENEVYLSPISSTTLYKRAFTHFKEG